MHQSNLARIARRSQIPIIVITYYFNSFNCIGATFVIKYLRLTTSPQTAEETTLTDPPLITSILCLQIGIWPGASLLSRKTFALPQAPVTMAYPKSANGEPQSAWLPIWDHASARSWIASVHGLDFDAPRQSGRIADNSILSKAISRCPRQGRSEFGSRDRNGFPLPFS